MRHHITSVISTAIIKKKKGKCWRGCGETGTFVYCWWECKVMQPVQKTVWRFIKKSNTDNHFTTYGSQVTML